MDSFSSRKRKADQGFKEFSTHRLLPESLRSPQGAPSVTQAKDGASVTLIVVERKKLLTFMIILLDGELIRWINFALSKWINFRLSLLNVFLFVNSRPSRLFKDPNVSSGIFLFFNFPKDCLVSLKPTSANA